VGIMPSPPHIQMRFFGNKGVGGGGREGVAVWENTYSLILPRKNVVCRTVLVTIMWMRSSLVLICYLAEWLDCQGQSFYFIFVSFPALHFIYFPFFLTSIAGH
jgi:hypothetical protein